MKANTIPFVKIAFSVLLGISLSIFLRPEITIAILGIIALVFHFHKKFKNSVVYMMLAMLSFVIGYISFHQNPFEKLNQQTYEWKGIVIDKGQKFSKGMKYIIQVISVNNRQQEVAVKGKVLLMSKNENNLRQGEIVKFVGKCNAITYQDTSFWNQINFKKGLQATVWSYQVHKTQDVNNYFFF